MEYIKRVEGLAHSSVSINPTEHQLKFKIMKVLIFACLIAASYAAVAPGYHKPAAPYHEVYEDVPPQYNYQYGVHDPNYGANFQQTESRDGYNTKGSYTVNLPDGRVQTVNYYDNGDGLVAEVTYSGEAQYPAAHGPSYKAKPAPYHA